MFCPDCGYNLTAFDKECPRCARRRAGGIPPTTLPIHVGPVRETPDPDQTIAYQFTPPPPPNGKACPSCSSLADVAAPYCLRCGHRYRTAFPPNVQPSTQYQPAQYPPAPDMGQPYQNQPDQQPYQDPPPYSPPYGQYPYPYQPGLIQVPPGSHSVTAAVILALFINGTGQMVNKQVAKNRVVA